MRRRRFLETMAVGGLAALASPARGQSPVAAFARPLRLPARSGLLASTAVDRPLLLTAGIRREAILPGRTTDLWAYRDWHGAVNPVLRVRRGRTLDVTLHNRLGEDTTIHWHGLHVDERNDGSGLHPVAPNDAYVYRFAVRNRAGLYWYHAHPHHRTGAQIHQGLAGMLIVEDDEDDALRAQLDLTPGVTDLPLMIQDKAVDSLNRLRHGMGEEDWIGNRVFVNWTAQPFLDLATRLYRFRLLNASNARVYRLAFTLRRAPLPFHLIGTDCGLLDRAHTVSEVFLAPGQRADVLLDLAQSQAGDEVLLTSLPYDPMEDEPRENEPGAAVPEVHRHNPAPMGKPLDILLLRVREQRNVPYTLPDRISSLNAAPAAEHPLRRFRLHTDGARWYINGINYHEHLHAAHVIVRRGAREIWEIMNDMQSMPHPMHLHGFQFRVIARSGSPAQVQALASIGGLTSQDLGQLDTVLTWPGETVRLALDFAHDFPGDQRYMFHCHNLEHEDQGMMLDVKVAG
jgi:FtsP/CotA-like multicopper oxidase with cupredoxin domain